MTTQSTMTVPADQRVRLLRSWSDDLDLELVRLQEQRSAIADLIDRLGGNVRTPPPRPIDPPKTTKQRTKASTPPTRPAGKSAGRPSNIPRPSHEEVAAVSREAQAAGRSIAAFVAERFGVSWITAKKWSDAADAALPAGAKVSQIRKQQPVAPTVSVSSNATLTTITATPKERPATRLERHGKKPASSRPDLDLVAADIVQLRSEGRPIAKELSIKYHVPESTARNWMATCRATGLVPAQRADLKVVEDNTGPIGEPLPYDEKIVVATYLDAVRSNSRRVQAIADRFNVDRTTAIAWIARARNGGALPPAGEPQLPEDERRRLLEVAKPEPVA